MSTKHYRAPDGTVYPMEEADTPFGFMVYRSDRRKAKTGDPTCCLIALGLQRHRMVQAAYIGSAKDAYVIFKATSAHPAFARHYVINAKAAAVRDAFDQKKAPKTQTLTLQPPTAGRTHEHRAALGKRRRAEIKAGAEVKTRGTIRQTRIMRIGVPHRPHAHIVDKAIEIG